MCWKTLEKFQQVFVPDVADVQNLLKYHFFAKSTEGNFTIAQKILKFLEVGMSMINGTFLLF